MAMLSLTELKGHLQASSALRRTRILRLRSADTDAIMHAQVRGGSNARSVCLTLQLQLTST